MTSNRKDAICALLKGIETGDENSVNVVHTERYIQHNPQTKEGGEGLAALFKRLSKTSPRVNIVRVFADGEFVFAHTEYDFGKSRIGFEVFRFEGDKTVEHWDNIQLRKGPNESGHTMVDGTTRISDYDKTELNRNTVITFVNDVLIGRNIDLLENYVNNMHYVEHNPGMGDECLELTSALSACIPGGSFLMQYERAHRFLAEGNFVLSVCEGRLSGAHTSFYDLFRLAKGKIVEHWDTTETIPPRDEWKNDNGKF